MHSIGRHHVSCDFREKFAVVAAVVRNADADILRIDRVAISVSALGSVCLDVVCKSLGSHSHGVLVHPVGTYAHDSAKTAGTEFKVTVECILESCRIVVSQFNDLAFRLRIEISIKPALSYFSKIFCHSYIVFLDFQCLKSGFVNIARINHTKILNLCNIVNSRAGNRHNSWNYDIDRIHTRTRKR